VDCWSITALQKSIVKDMATAVAACSGLQRPDAAGLQPVSAAAPSMHIQLPDSNTLLLTQLHLSKLEAAMQHISPMPTMLYNMLHNTLLLLSPAVALVAMLLS
jgi:hypothetical protein